MPIIAALVIGLAGGVLISNYTILGKELSISGSAEQEEQKLKRRFSTGWRPWIPLIVVTNQANRPWVWIWFRSTLKRQKEPEILYWVAPMDPDYRRDKPGKSPMGMDLVPVYADEGAEQRCRAYQFRASSKAWVCAPARRRVRSLWRKVDATGYVGFDETRVSQINLRTEGWIERLLVKNEGERVSKGQLLFEFYSPQLVNAQKEYVQSKRRDDTPDGQRNRREIIGPGHGRDRYCAAGERQKSRIPCRCWPRRTAPSPA